MKKCMWAGNFFSSLHLHHSDSVAGVTFKHCFCKFQEDFCEWKTCIRNYESWLQWKVPSNRYMHLDTNTQSVRVGKKGNEQKCWQSQRGSTDAVNWMNGTKFIVFYNLQWKAFNCLGCCIFFSIQLCIRFHVNTFYSAAAAVDSVCCKSAGERMSNN